MEKVEIILVSSFDEYIECTDILFERGLRNDNTETRKRRYEFIKQNTIGDDLMGIHIYDNKTFNLFRVVDITRDIREKIVINAYRFTIEKYFKELEDNIDRLESNINGYYV